MVRSRGHSEKMQLAGDLEVVGRYRGTRDSGEKSGRVTFGNSEGYILH